jgi:hypothetical protein
MLKALAIDGMTMTNAAFIDDLRHINPKNLPADGRKKLVDEIDAVLPDSRNSPTELAFLESKRQSFLAEPEDRRPPGIGTFF